MHPESYVVDFLPVTVRRGNLLRALGYEGRGVLTPRVEEMIREGMEEGVKLLEPRGVYTLYPVQEAGESQITITGEVSFRTGLISRVFRDVRLVAVFIVTIGPEVERKVEELSREGYMSRALAFDVFGSEAAESAAEIINGIVEEWAAIEGRRTTLRFSPGYWIVQALERPYRQAKLSGYPFSLSVFFCLACAGFAICARRLRKLGAEG